MKRLLVLVLIIMIITGCTQFRETDHGNNSATTSERSDYQTTTDLSKIPAPSMVKENIHQSDENVIKWIQEIDNWMFSVIRTPKSGTMDEQTKLVIQNHLAQFIR